MIHSNLHFVSKLFRWLILGFKREFAYEESLELFEIISSQHLELHSMEAEKERDKQRHKEREKDGEYDTREKRLRILQVLSSCYYENMQV